MKQLFRQLKRRNVYKVAVAYAVVAFVVWQVMEHLFPAFGFPAWTIDFAVVLTLIGFLIALVLAWAFEMMPEGVRGSRRHGRAGRRCSDRASTTTRRAWPPTRRMEPGRPGGHSGLGYEARNMFRLSAAERGVGGGVKRRGGIR